jgi:hypothetical protein
LASLCMNALCHRLTMAFTLLIYRRFRVCAYYMHSACTTEVGAKSYHHSKIAKTAKAWIQ